MKVYRFCCSGNCPEIREEKGIITLVDDWGGSVSMTRNHWVEMARKWLKREYIPVVHYIGQNEIRVMDYVDHSVHVRMPRDQFKALIEEFFKVCDEVAACPV